MAASVIFMPSLFRSQDASSIGEAVLTAWRFWLSIVMVLVIAFMSNPTEASFRNFLTDLSFHMHLRKLRSSTTSAAGPASDSHVLTFSNRISISLRTPAYVFRSFGLFSTVTIAPSAHGYAGRGVAKAVADQEEGGVSTFGSRSTLFIGAFGHWWAWEESMVDDSAAVKDRLASSVMAMESLDEKPLGTGTESPTYGDEKEESILPGDIRGPVLSPKKAIRPVKAEFRAGQRRASPITRSSRDKSSITPPLELQQQSEPLAEARLAAALAEKKLASIQASAQLSSPSSSDEAATPESPSEAVVDEIVTDLQKQIESAKAASDAAQAKLQAELEQLRQQKKEEDKNRAEAKARTRVLEEGKRLAEVERAEADKKRNAARLSRQTMLDHIERLKHELSRLDRKEADHERKLTQSQADCSAKIAKLKEQLAIKQDELAQAEVSLKKVTARVEILEQAIEARKAELDSKRHEAGAMWAQIQQRSVSNPAYYGSNDAAYHWLPAGDPMTGSGSSSNSPIAMPDQPGYAYNRTESAPIKSSFLEHRLWHQREHANPLDSLYPTSVPQSRFASAENLHDHSNFAPFGPQLTQSRSLPHPEQGSPDQGGARNLALPFFMHGSLTSLTGEMSPNSTRNGMPDPGPLSPMTPHQASLLPSHLFNLLDDDEDEEESTAVFDAEKQVRPIGSERNQSGDKSPSDSLDLMPTSRSPVGQNMSAMSHIASEWNNIPDGSSSRHPLSLNPSAKAFNFTMPAQDEEVMPEKTGRSGFDLREVWNKAVKKSSGGNKATSSFSPFEDNLLA